jgi:hypothetical protein
VIREAVAAARRREFVGRRDELALVEGLLEAGEGAVVYVHGPGGIGKSSLLHQYAWLGERHGRRVVRFDADGCGQSAAAVEAGLAQAGLNATAGTAVPLLLLIDGADDLVPLGRWLREELLTRLPAGTLVVLAGRQRPGLGWRTDPGWRSLLHPVQLRELDAADSREVLRRRGVSDAGAGAALAFARGHPLALALAAELGDGVPVPARRGEGPREPLRDLLAVLLDTVPTPLHRAALEASAQVLVTTEPLLAALIGTDGLFDWLRGLSVIESGPRGIRPHDLVRDLLAAELRWRDPEQVVRLRQRAREWYRGRLDHGATVLPDLAYLHRDSPLLGPFLSCVIPVGAAPGLAVTPMRDGEWPALRQWLVRHEGEASAALVDGWVSPATVSVVRDEDGAATGFMVVLALDRLDPAGIRRRGEDPATSAAWRCVTAPGPAIQLRTWLARDTYQAVSPAQTRMIFHLVGGFLSTPGLAYTFLPVADPEYWAGAGAYIDLRRLPGADFTVGGRRYGMFVHDWHEVPPAVWLQRLADREPAATGGREDLPAEPLGEAAFAAAVRDALRELDRPDRLAGNPLTGTRLATPGDGADRVQALRDAVRDAAAVLRDSPGTGARTGRCTTRTCSPPGPSSAPRSCWTCR